MAPVVTAQGAHQMRFPLAFGILALALLAAGAGPVCAQSSAVVIVDGSGSMWGALAGERTSKFDLARAGLRLGLTGAASSARLGLVSFGHRRRADCSDVETLIAPQSGSAEPFLAAVDRLNPKGKGPLALALREAAKSFEPGMAGSILLIHDGPDNCQQDPCVAAADIAKTNPRLAVHVLSLGLERPDFQRMACVSALTRGKAFDIRDTASLNAAIVESAHLAGLDDRAPSAQSDASGADSGAAPTAAQPPGLRLTAALAQDGPSLSRPVLWRIAREETPDTTILQRSAPQIDEDLPTGKYVVTARLDAAEARLPIEVGEAGRTTLKVALNAGTVNFAARATKSGDAIASPLLSISPATDAKPAQRVRDPIWIGRDPNAQVVVPAGNYVVRIEDGLVSREAPIAVAPGSPSDAQFVLGAGRLELTAVALAGGEPLQTVTYAISEDDPEAPGGRREIARSAATRAGFVLPAGTYHVTATTGAAEASERLAVGAGGDVKHTIVLNVGRAIVSVQLDGAPPPASEMITYRVLSIEDASREVARSSRSSPDFLLAAGRYRFEAMLAGQNVRTAADIDIAAGKEYRIALKLESAEVTIRPATSASVAGSVRWEVKDNQGRIVLRSGIGGAKTARLSPGRYMLSADSAGGAAEQSFDLKAGEQRTVDLSLQ